MNQRCLQGIIKLVVCIVALTLLSCEGRTSSAADAGTEVECMPFYTYNKLDHYQIEISQDSISYLVDHTNTKYRQTPLTTLQLELAQILLSGGLSKLGDTVSLSRLETLGYTKHPVEKRNFGRIDELLCEGYIPEESKVNMCLPVYRDILVFRDSERIVGLCKLCFECDMSLFVGTNRKTYYFGQTGEFKKLAEILNVNTFY